MYGLSYTRVELKAVPRGLIVSQCDDFTCGRGQVDLLVWIWIEQPAVTSATLLKAAPAAIFS